MNRYVKIKDIAVLNRETFKKGSLPNIIKYLDTGSLTKNKIEGFQHLNIKLDKIPSRAQRKVRTNTILYSTVRPNQEHFGIIEREFEDIVASTGFTTIDITDKTVFPKFIFYLITQPNITEYLHTIGMNSVSSYPSISPDDIGNLKFKIPDLPTQKSIAKVLSDLDAKIELNNKINRELEAMAKTLYDYWFVQFDFPDANGKPYKSSGGKMVYNAELKKEIPEGWEVKKLGECIKIFDSQRIPLSNKERELKKGKIPYYGATGIMDYVNDFIFNDDYILLAEDGSVMNEDGFPIIQFIWGKTWVNNHAHVIQSKDKEQNEFYYQHLSMIPVILIKTGSIQMKINQDNLKNYHIIVPPNNLINRYSRFANSTRKSLINNIEQNQQLSSLRDWLLPMLMNGQVTVRQAHGKLETEERLSMAAEPSVKYGN